MLDFTPADAKALISDPTSSLCGNFVRTLLRLPVLFYELVSELYDASGIPKNTFRAGDIKYSFSVAGEDDHWKLCNGQTFNKNDYPDLFAAIGHIFDTMDDEHDVAQSSPGGDLFRVPRCGGRFPLVTGSLDSTTAVSSGSTGGEEKHVLIETEMPKHDHTVQFIGTYTSVTSTARFGGEPTGGVPDFSNADCPVTDEKGNDESHNNVPPYFGIYMLICTGI